MPRDEYNKLLPENLAQMEDLKTPIAGRKR
jgi:hypothetical protein